MANPFTLPRISVDDLLHEHGHLIEEAVNLTQAPEAYRQAFSITARNLARLAYNLPCTESHHDADPGGFFRHSLEVAVQALRSYNDERERGSISDSTVDDVWRRQLTVYCAALCHDLGRLMMIKVTVGDTVIRMGNTYLADAILETAESHYLAEFMPGRGLGTWRDHEPIGVYLVNMVVPIKIFRLLRLDNGNRFVWALTKTLADVAGKHGSSDIVRRTLKVGDRVATGAAMNKLSAQARADDQSSGINYGASFTIGNRLCQDVIAGWRAIYKDRRIAYNRPGAQVLVSPTHTIVATDTRPGFPSPILLIIEYVLQQLGDERASYKSHYDNGGDIAPVMKDMVDTYAQGPNPPLLALPHPQSQIPTARLYVRHIPEGTKTPKTMWAIVIANNLLWGERLPADVTSYSGAIEIRDPARLPTSIDPEEFGFVSLVRSDQPGPVQPGTAQATQQEPAFNEEESFLAELDCPPAEESAMRLWSMLPQLGYPLPEANDPLSDVWRTVNNRLAVQGKLEPDDLAIVLHHLVGRLTPDGGKAEVVSAEPVVPPDYAISADGVAQKVQPPVTATPDRQARDASVRTTLREVGLTPHAAIDVLEAFLDNVGDVSQDSSASTFDDRWIVWDGKHLGLSWPYGLANLLYEDSNDRKRCLPYLDMLLPKIGKEISHLLVPGRSGSPIHYVRLAAFPYDNRSAALNARAHHKFLLFDYQPRSEPNRYQAKTLHVEWTVLV